MPEKFTIEKHEEDMRRILTQAMPVERADVLGSLLERVRGREVARPIEGMPTPRPPRLPRLPARLPMVRRPR